MLMVCSERRSDMTNEATNLPRRQYDDSGEYSFAAPSRRTGSSFTASYKTIDLAGIRVGTQQFVTLV